MLEFKIISYFILIRLIMTKTSFKLSRRSFLLSLVSIYIAKNSSLIETITLSDKEIPPEATNSNLYKWILGKDDLK